MKNYSKSIINGYFQLQTLNHGSNILVVKTLNFPRRDWLASLVSLSDTLTASPSRQKGWRFFGFLDRPGPRLVCWFMMICLHMYSMNISLLQMIEYIYIYVIDLFDWIISVVHVGCNFIVVSSLI